MENHKNLNNLPETQALDSQTDMYTEESIYTEDEDVLHAWAKLTYVPDKSVLELKHNKGWFGRDIPNSNEKVDTWLFSLANCHQKYLEKISKCHFIIEREALSGSEKAAINMNPAYITCVGRNGLYVNDEKMVTNDKRILTHNDVIKLTKNQRLFEFQYTNWSQSFNELPKECVQKYYVGAELGSGGCGVVRLCFNVHTFEKVAMKVIRKETNRLTSSAIANNQKILNEVKIMKSLSNPHVLSLMDFYESPRNVVIIMEYLEGKDMLHRITQFDPNKKRLSEDDSRFFFIQAARGIKYLHDSFITHRDIKPDNILLQSLERDTLLKISDFGLSKLFAVETMKTVCGTQLYVAPEIYTGIYTNKVDIWSLGCVLFAMLSGGVPFHEGPNRPDLLIQIKEAQYEFRSRAWGTVSKTAQALIRRMLQKNPDDRPSIDEVLEHPWLKCPATLKRVDRLFQSDETIIGSDEIEQTMINITLDDTDRTILTPPPKRRRIDYN